MKKTILISLLALLIFQNIVHAQRYICESTIFPFCPGDIASQMLLQTPPPPTQFTPSCDSIQITIPPQYGVIECVGTGGNIQGKYHYTPLSNCSMEDSFVVENIYDTTLDTVFYLHLSFQCETPDDVFCCIPPDSEENELNVLQNDTTFINDNYDYISFTITLDDIVDPPKTERRKASIRLFMNLTLRLPGSIVLPMHSPT